LLTRYGNGLYWLLERLILGPLLLRPTEWVLEKLTLLYAVTLRWSLRLWPAVLALGLVLILVAAAFLYFDLLGRELVPTEDQSRLLVHVICPVGSSIQQVSELLSRCENALVQHDEVAGILTTVATEPGQLMNQADLFVQLVPQHARKKKQQVLAEEFRKELEAIEDIRLVVRDQSTEGFTATRGDPV